MARRAHPFALVFSGVKLDGRCRGTFGHGRQTADPFWLYAAYPGAPMSPDTLATAKGAPALEALALIGRISGRVHYRRTPVPDAELLA